MYSGILACEQAFGLGGRGRKGWNSFPPPPAPAPEADSLLAGEWNPHFSLNLQGKQKLVLKIEGGID